MKRRPSVLPEAETSFAEALVRVAVGAALLALTAGGGCARPKTELRAEPAPAARTTTAPATESRPAAGAMTATTPGPMTPYPPTTYVAGPALTPTAPLLAWLDAHRDTLIKVPVVIRRLPPPLEIEMSYLGATAAPPAADAVHVHLDDGHLGVSLMDHVRRKCKDQPVCVVWVEGYWHDLGDNDTESTPPGSSRHTFSLYRVHDPVEPNLVDPHVLVAKEEKPEQRDP